MPALLTLDRLSFQTPDGRTLFENLTLSFGAERTGLVGRNGVGKTTLLRLILGEATPASGSATVRGRIGVLRQTLAPDPDETVADRLGVSEALALLARIEEGCGSEADFAAADWLLEARLTEALEEVGLAGLDRRRSAASLSGGELTRVALAGLLAQAPDLILLDEPTNNLDASARRLVAGILHRWRGGAIVVSHDRTLLREMDRTVELTSIGAHVYGGNYDLYAARKADEVAAAARDLDLAERSAAAVDREIQAAREKKARRDSTGRKDAARGGQPKMTRDAQAERAEATAGRGSRLADRLRDQAAEVLAQAQARVERLKPLRFELPPTLLPAGRTVLVFDGVGFAYNGRAPLLSNLSFRVVGPERVAVRGANGSGKTSLIKLAVGELEPASGRVSLATKAALLDQQTAMLDEDETLVEAFHRLNPKATDFDARAALARFLFRNIAADKRVASLSGGERLRAALAMVLMSASPPQLLILDEPTNHLDLDSIAAIEAALAGYDGALLVVSHDSDFLEAIGIGRTIDLPASA